MPVQNSYKIFDLVLIKSRCTSNVTHDDIGELGKASLLLDTSLGRDPTRRELVPTDELRDYQSADYQSLNYQAQHFQKRKPLDYHQLSLIRRYLSESVCQTPDFHEFVSITFPSRLKSDQT